MPESPTTILDPASSDAPGANSRDGAGKRRDPNEPAAVVGLGASAGGLAVLQQFFNDMPVDSGLAYVVVMHLAPDYESNLASILQQRTKMPVLQVSEPVKVKPNHIYVIPPNHQLTFEDSTLQLVAPQQAQGRRITIDLFLRTLAQAYGQRAVAVILSGTDSDGVIGLKHVRAQGGVTMAQDPNEAEYDSMPITAINTGMVDWVLPVSQMPPKLMEFVRNESRMKIPPELPEASEADAKDATAPGGETVSDETRAVADETAIGEILAHLRGRTGHDFTHYKRATVLRRVARRLQVNSLESLPEYLKFLHRHPAECPALLQDLLIGVTHFFRDQEAFAALEANVPQLFAGKRTEDQIRVWVAGCATGEEAYSLAILLCEHAEKLSDPPSVQIFASDVDEHAIQDARDGLYPATIEADVSIERLRRFFRKDHGRYRVQKELREKVLFAAHDLLKDPPFSRIDLVSCRNLLIYLNLQAQAQVFDIFHFALRSGGLLFVGGAESSQNVESLFSPVDARHRIYVRRSVPRPAWRIPFVPRAQPAPAGLPFPKPRTLPPLSHQDADDAGSEKQDALFVRQERRAALFGELHLKLLEQYAPPSIVVNEAHDIVHLSEHGGRYLHFVAGEPTASVMSVVHPALRIELRTALFRAAQDGQAFTGAPQAVQIDSAQEEVTVHVRPVKGNDPAQGFFLVVFEKTAEPKEAEPKAERHDEVTRKLDEEIQSLKEQLSSTVEQYDASNEELKASNEELQAANEEMRSATEELETSKEELQSVNEELSTVNHELKSNVEELSRTNADLNNLMGSTDIGTVFLDRQLRIQRFTPSAQRIFNLIPADLGRPLSDITHRLAYGDLIRDAEQVLDKWATIEREVRLEEKNWYLVRIAPYRIQEDRIAGVVATFIDITQRRLSELALAESEERFRQFAENSADVFWIVNTKTRRLEYLNPVTKKMWGEPRENFMHDIDHWLKIVHPDDRKRASTAMPRVLRGEVVTVQYRIVRPTDGAVLWIRDTGFPIRNEAGEIYRVAGVAQDVTEDHSQTEALAESEERFRLLVEGARDYAIFLLDPANQIIHWSAGAERIFGWSADEALGESGNLIFTPEDRAKKAEQKELETALREGSASDRRWHLRKDGSRIWIEGVMQRLDDEKGDLRGFAKIARDASDRRRFEDELRAAHGALEQRVMERTRDLVATNRELERTMAQRQELERELLQISEREKRRIGEDLHDMVCQELTATALFLKASANKVAAESATGAETLEEAARIVNNNVGLARDLARGLQPAELKGSGLKDALGNLCTHAAENSEIKCHLKVAKGVRVTDGNVALHLYRVAQEAVNNAVKHSGAKNILITLDKNPENVCVTVEDDGKGFSPNRRSKGLGLHIMRYRAHALGGDLKIEKRKRGGMQITCIIPVKR